MKIRFLIFMAIALTTMHATAQETSNEREFEQAKRTVLKNELGLAGEINSGNISGFRNAYHNSYLGIQYKRWIKPNTAWRIMISEGDFNYNAMPHLVEKRGDTAISTQTYGNVPMYYIGSGFEVQRQFYRKVVLYAAAELRVGYGKGHFDNMEITEVLREVPFQIEKSSVYHDMRIIGSGDISTFTIDATPFIGAKINFKRITLGTEATLLKAGFYSIKNSATPNYKYTSDDFHVGGFRQRVYVNFRF